MDLTSGVKTSGSQSPAQFVTHGSPSPKHDGVCVSGETEEEEQSAAFTKREQALQERYDCHMLHLQIVLLMQKQNLSFMRYLPFSAVSLRMRMVQLFLLKESCSLA